MDEQKIEGQEGPVTPPEGETPEEVPKEAPKEPVTQPTPPPVDYEARYKGLQREHQKVIDGQKAKLDRMEKDISFIVKLLAKKPAPTEDIFQTEEPEKPSEAEQYLQLRETEQQQETARERLQLARDEILQLSTDAGLDGNGPELLAARTLWGQGDFNGALQEVRRIALETHKSHAATTRAKLQEAEGKRAKALESETGTGGATSTFTQIEQAYAEGKIGLAEYSKALRERKQ